MSTPDTPVATLKAPQIWMRYVATTVVLNLIWEIAQMPLYTLWNTGSLAEISFAVFHCTVGDMLIAAISLTSALAILRARDWPMHRYRVVAVVTLALGLSYTVFSEWWNIEARQAWAYRDLMPRVPVLGTGLSPLSQWIVVPLLAMWIVRPRRKEDHLCRNESQNAEPYN